MSASDWEAAFARLLLDDGFRRRVWEGDAAALSRYDLDADERGMLLALDRQGVERFARGLRLKRLVRLRAALPLSFRALGQERDRLLDRYVAAYPSVPALCAREVRDFASVGRAWARGRGLDWLGELIDWEARGHLAWCRDAIDAEGAVLGHLPGARTEAPPVEPVPEQLLDRPLRPVDGAWIEERPLDLPSIAAWYDADPARDGPPPAELLADRSVRLLRRPRPGPGNRGVAVGPPLEALWRRLDGRAATRRLVRDLDPAIRPDAWIGMLDHLHRLGLVEPGPGPGRTRGWWRRPAPRPAQGAPGIRPVDGPGPSWSPSTAPRFGIGLRRPYAAALAGAPAPGLEVLELYAEDYAGAGAEAATELDRLRALYLLIPHGLELSLGSAAPPEPTALRDLRDLLDRIGAPFYTEHLAWTRAPEWRPGHLCPVWPSPATIDRVAGRIEAIQDALGRPLAIENISYDLLLPGSGLAEADVFGRLVARTGCRALLDVTNVAVNAHNHGFDPVEFLRRFPLDAVVQLHLVGYTTAPDGLWVDAHAEAAQTDVVDLAALALRLGASPAAVVIERDRALPALPALLAELDAVRRRCTEDGPARPGGP